MANSYTISEEYDITREEGATGSIVFSIASDVLDLGVYSTVRFQVRNEEDIDRTLTPTISKTTDSGITVSGQTVTVALAVSDTADKYGSDYRWEIQFEGNDEVIPLMRGDFKIIKKVIA